MRKGCETLHLLGTMCLFKAAGTRLAHCHLGLFVSALDWSLWFWESQLLWSEGVCPLVLLPLSRHSGPSPVQFLPRQVVLGKLMNFF